MDSDAGIGRLAIFYGGYTGSVQLNTCTRIEYNGSQIGVETNIGTVREGLGGAPIGELAVYYGGATTSGVRSNVLTKINTSGTLYGSESTVGTGTTRTSGLGLS